MFRYQLGINLIYQNLKSRRHRANFSFLISSFYIRVHLAFLHSLLSKMVFFWLIESPSLSGQDGSLCLPPSWQGCFTLFPIPVYIQTHHSKTSSKFIWPRYHSSPLKISHLDLPSYLPTSSKTFPAISHRRTCPRNLLLCRSRLTLSLIKNLPSSPLPTHSICYNATVHPRL